MRALHFQWFNEWDYCHISVSFVVEGRGMMQEDAFKNCSQTRRLCPSNKQNETPHWFLLLYSRQRPASRPQVPCSQWKESYRALFVTQTHFPAGAVTTIGRHSELPPGRPAPSPQRPGHMLPLTAGHLVIQSTGSGSGWGLGRGEDGMSVTGFIHWVN